MTVSVLEWSVIRTALSGVMYQLERSWLKEGAFSNISSMLVTDETSQALRGWLKAGGTIEHVGHGGDG